MLAYVKLCIGAHCKDENNKKTHHNKKKIPWFTKTFYTKAFCTAYMQYSETRGLDHSPLKLLSIIQTWWGKLKSSLSAPERKVFFCFFVFFQGNVQKNRRYSKSLLKGILQSGLLLLQWNEANRFHAFFQYSPVWRIICLHWLWPPHSQSSKDISF